LLRPRLPRISRLDAFIKACAILVIMILGIVVMAMVIAMVIVVLLVARVWDDRGGEERGN
jgi:hypothetical protein